MSKSNNTVQKLSKTLAPKLKKSKDQINRKTKKGLRNVVDITLFNVTNSIRGKKKFKKYKGFNYFLSARRTKKDESSITKSYSAFSYIIILLVIIWTALNAFSIYNSQSKSFAQKVEVQKTIIESIFSNSVSLIDNFSSYVGDKILLFGIEDKNAIATILKRNNSTDLLPRNFYSWLDVNYVDTKRKLIVSSKDGVLKEPQEIPPYYPVKESLKKTWIFKLGKITLIESLFGDYEVIPVAFSIDDYDYNPKGTLISKIILRKVNDDIKEGVEDEDVGYIVLDEHLDFVAFSQNDVILQDEKKKKTIEAKIDDHTEIRTIFKQAKDYGTIETDGVLERPIHIGNTTYRNYRKSDYPFIVLVGYSKKAVWKSFQKSLNPVLLQSSVITFLFLSALFLFKKIQIIPIIKQLISAREKAEEASKAKSGFLSTISHELRTPMNGIIGMSQILSESRNLDDEEWDQVQTIHRSANALLLILNDILNFAKIEAQKVELEKIDFDLHVVIENTIDILFPTATKKGLELLTNIDYKIPRILLGDPGRIRQIITNLVNNAIKFTENGQVTVEILYKKKSNDDYFLRFNIKDSGIGIKAADLKKLFNQFTQADMTTTRKYGGTGLGLSICKELVRLMGGKIEITSKFGEGSNFWFEIPLTKSNTISEIPKEKERHQIKNKKFAIIDNNPVSSEIFKTKLSNLFDSKTETTSAIAIENFNSGTTDLLINELINGKCDVITINHSNDHKMQSIKLAQAIKSTKELKNTPIILIISSHEKSKISTENISLFKATVSKPIRELSFIHAILDANNIEYTKDDRPPLSEDMNETSKESYKILLCEDNPINVKVVCAILGKMGYNIDVACDGQEGFDKFMAAKGDKKYDIILMDCMMPKVDGFGATKMIRAQEKQDKLPKTPIIALTANISQEDQNKCAKSGMDDFLSKPLKRDLVSQAIQRCIEDTKKRT